MFAIAGALAAADTAFPALAKIRSGDGTMALEAHAALPELAPGRHRLLFRNANESKAGVYLANALVPDDNRVTIGAQERDGAQSELTIDFAMHGSPVGTARAWTLMATLSAGVWWAARRRSNAPRRD